MNKFKSLAFIGLVMMALMSCEKEEVNESTEMVTFKLNVAEFSNSAHGMKSAELEYTDFEHKYKGAIVIFTNAEGEEWSFDTRGTNQQAEYSLEEVRVALPLGTYTLTGESSTVHNFKAESKMTYTIPSQEVTVENSTEILNISIQSDVALVLIKNENHLLSEGYLFSSLSTGYGGPLTTDTDIESSPFKYAYTLPKWYESHPTYDYTICVELKLVKLGERVFTVKFDNMEKGYIYYIVVTENVITGVTLTNDFKLWGTITW